jgi:hypothetical protein
MQRWLIVSLLSLVFCVPAHATIDPINDDAFGTLAAGIDSSTTTMIAITGVGTKFPASFPYTVTVYNCTDYGASHLDPSRERVRVTNRSSDTFTITRGQEGTSAVNHNTAGKTYCIHQALTRSMVDAIRTDIANAGGSINDVVDASTKASLNTAISDLCGSSAVKMLRISDSQTLSSNATVCPNVTIWIAGSGKISINSSVVLAIQGPMLAPVRKIFDGAGTVQGLTFARGEWFGCARDGSTDDTVCLQTAVNSISSGGGTLVAGKGTYKITAIITVGSDIRIQGEGMAATFFKGQLTTAVFRSPNTAVKYYRWQFENFTCDNTDKANVGGTCFDLTNVEDARFERVNAQNVETCYYVNSMSGGTIANTLLIDSYCLTATNGALIVDAVTTELRGMRFNNVTNCIDVNNSTGTYLYSPKCEAFTNGIRIGNSSLSTQTRIFWPILSNTPTVGTGISISAGSTRTSVYDPLYTGLTTNLTSAASAGEVFILDSGYLIGARGFSGSASTAFNTNGVCTFAASTTCTVTFGTAQADTSYRIQLGCNANKTFYWSSKTTSGFTINGSSSGSDTCDWWITR